MKKLNVLQLLSLCLIMLLASCSDDDNGPSVTDVDGRYLVMSSTSAYATGEAYLSLYDTMPSGDINNVITNTTQVDAYGRFVVINNEWAFKKYKFTGETGIVRYSLDETGSLVTDGFISTPEAPNYFIVDETTGFYINTDRSTLAVQIFNPSTMERTGSIDASSLISSDDLEKYDVAVGSETLVVSGDKLFANVSYDVKDDAPDGTKAPHYTMVVMDITTLTAEKLIEHEGEVYNQGHSSTTEYSGLLVTDDGTIYLATHALFAEDDNGEVPKACIFRINGGETDFDQDWVLTGSDILGGGDDDRKVVWSIAYANDKLYVDCSDESITIPGFSNLMTNMYNVYAVDPETKSATKITGAPATIFGHADGNLFDVNGEIFYQVKNDDEGSGYYRINSDNTATNVFNITDTYPRAIGYLEIQD